MNTEITKKAGGDSVDRFVRHDCRSIPNEIMNAARVIAFAQENGFPNARAIYWWAENPECGYESLGEIVEDCGENYEINIGIELNHGGLIARKDYDEKADDDGEIYILPNAQDQP